MKSPRLAGILCLSATILLFSTFEVVSKLLAPRLGPMQITFSRFLIGGLVLLPFALWRFRRRTTPWTWRRTGHVALLGFVNIVVSMGLVQLGLVMADAAISAALFSANPLFVVLFARLLLGERLRWPKLLGLGLGLAGVAMLFADKLGTRSPALAGLGLVGAAALVFALYTVLGKKYIAQSGSDSLTVTCFSFLAGSLMLLPLMALLGVSPVFDARGVEWPLLYMALGVTGLAYVLYFEGLGRLEAGAGSLLYFAKPALATILALLVLGERPGLNQLCGMAVIAAGILLSQFIRPRPARQPGQSGSAPAGEMVEKSPDRA